MGWGLLANSLVASPLRAGALLAWTAAHGCCRAAPARLRFPLGFARRELTVTLPMQQGLWEERAFPWLGTKKTLKSAFSGPNSNSRATARPSFAPLRLSPAVLPCWASPRRGDAHPRWGRSRCLSCTDSSSSDGHRAGKDDRLRSCG